ncbi:MAG: FAD-dependent oxidoreductase [Gammaproteobacteria bacterium]|nr:FAD-dependent oxidoreductase [Gammaproteobacteria bacterium]
MSHVVVVGAGIAGTSAAFELRETLPAEHRITLVNPVPSFRFVPSNPWVAVGWRKEEQVTAPLDRQLERKNIDFVAQPVAKVDPAASALTLGDGSVLPYDFVVLATGPDLAFDEIPGFGPDAGRTVSICTLEHAQHAWEAYQRFVETPGPVVIGAAQGASCFGPAYEFAMILDADLRKRRIRDKVPMTFVTSEPYVGHMGLGGVGDSQGLMESEFRQRHIKWITNAKVDSVEAEQIAITTHDTHGQAVESLKIDYRFAMLLPAFRGVAAVRGAEGLVNPRGFVVIDEHQRNPAYPNVYAAGVGVALPPVEATPVPTGAPKTGYMIESMVSAIAHNIAAELEGREPTATATWNAICLADMGDTGIAFVALPQMPPRNVTWAKKGKWVHLGKIAFEKYFLRKVRQGAAETIYERYVLKALGIEKLKAT